MDETSGTTPAIEVRGLVKRFGPLRAVDGLDLSVARGEFLTLFGPNGAGKTTLVRMLATLSYPSAGEVLILGSPLREIRSRTRSRIGVVSHASFLYGALSARDNLLFYARMFEVPQPARRVEQVLDLVDLRARQRDAVRTFSRGLVQRCSIARALLHEPDILLLDEPFSGLDPTASNRLSTLLEQAHEGGRTLVMTSHDLDRGLQLADRIAILDRGRLAFSARRSEVSTDEIVDLYERVTRPRGTR